MRTLVFLFVFAIILNFPISKSCAELFSPSFENIKEKIKVVKELEVIKRDESKMRDLEKKLEIYKSLSDEERETIKANFARFKAKSAYEQKSIEDNFGKFNRLSPELQRRYRDNFERFKKLPSNIQKRLRGDVKFRSQFNKSASEKGKSLRNDKIRKQILLKKRLRRSEAGSIV